MIFFSQIATERDGTALRFRYKKIMKAIRSFSAWETANARATGGGQPSKRPDTDGITITGALLALKTKFGVGISGMASIDSDAIDLARPIFDGKFE